MTEASLSNLSTRQEAALREALEFIHRTSSPIGIVVCGSLVLGEGDESSDLDLYVVWERRERQRIQKVFGGVPAEIFINPPAKVREYFRAEAVEGAPSTADMLARGVVVHGGDEPVIQELVDEARAVLRSRPDPTEAELTEKKYAAATALEDGRDRLPIDPATAVMFLTDAVCRMVEFWFLDTNQMMPRRKERMAAIATAEPEFGALLDAFWLEAVLEEKLSAAEKLADAILGERGFFEWSSEIEPVEEGTEDQPS